MYNVAYPIRPVNILYFFIVFFLRLGLIFCTRKGTPTDNIHLPLAYLTG